MNNVEILENKIKTISKVCDMCLNNGMGKEKSLKYIKKLLDIKDWKVKCCNGCNHNVLTEDEEYYCEVSCEPNDNICIAKDTKKIVDKCDSCLNNETNACNHCDTQEGGGANYLPMYIENLKEYDAHLLSDKEMVEAGFTRNEEAKYWFYDRILNLKDNKVEISFWFQINDNGEVEYCLIDEDFAQPFNYNKENYYYELLEEETKKKIEQLETSGIITKKKV